MSLSGHLYDTSLINQALNMIEDKGGRFSIVNQNVSPNVMSDSPDSANKSLQVTSTVAVQVTVEQGRAELDSLIASLRTLAENTPRAEAVVRSMPYTRTMLLMCADAISIDPTSKTPQLLCECCWFCR